MKSKISWMQFGATTPCGSTRVLTCPDYDDGYLIDYETPLISNGYFTGSVAE